MYASLLKHSTEKLSFSFMPLDTHPGGKELIVISIKPQKFTEKDENNFHERAFHSNEISAFVSYF